MGSACASSILLLHMVVAVLGLLLLVLPTHTVIVLFVQLCVLAMLLQLIAIKLLLQDWVEDELRTLLQSVCECFCGTTCRPAKHGGRCGLIS